jgi:hypothetical protein
VSALDGTSIRFDIVVRIVRPETDSPSRGPAAAVLRRAETGGWNFIRRGGFWYSGAVCYLRSLAPGIFCSEPRVRRGKELSRDGAPYQGW